MPARPAPSSTSRRKKLSRDSVFRAAVQFADARGVEALSMRELAREMGYGAMSLYNHVANKDEILAGMVELAASEIDIPTASSGDWKADLRGIARSAHETLIRHRWAASRWFESTPGPARLRYNEAILRVLRDAGCTVGAACSGFHAITTHVLGFTLQHLDFPVAEEDLANTAREFLADMPIEEFPYFAEHVQHHIDVPEVEDGFGLVLDLILDGLESDLSGEGKTPA